MRTIVIFLLPIWVYGWWDVGHMLTAQIAQKKLWKENPYAAVHFEDLLLSINALVDNRSRTFVETASWADDIKGYKYNMKLWNSWHFINKLYVPDGTFAQINFTNTAVNALEVINSAIRVLSSNMNRVSAERALFARYLVHLIGDVHQPLHSVALYNGTYPTGDLGGNRLKVNLVNGSSSNFHSFWDAGAYLIQNDTWKLVRPMDDQNISALNKVADSLIGQFDGQIQELAQELNPAEWIMESLRICQNFTYPYLADTDQLDEAYTAEAYEVSKKRITLAGYRIANTVMSIYENNPITFNVEEKWNQMKVYVDGLNKEPSLWKSSEQSINVDAEPL